MRVLVSVDDDPVLPAVLAALEKLVALSQWDEVSLLHVVSPQPVLLHGGRVPPSRAKAFLRSLAETLDHLPAGLQTLVARGEPALEIARVAEEREVDLVVMGALGGRRDFLMGSVSQKVVSLVEADVLVARELRRDGAAEEGFRALLAVDGSLGSEAGIEAFARKLRSRLARIRLVHVVEPIPTLWQANERSFALSFSHQANEILGRARKRLARRGLAAECEWRQGSPAGQILDVAREEDTDLIVIGSRGHSTLRDMVLGSITQRILRHAPCTVFCARAWGPESAELPTSWSRDEWEPEVGLA